MRRFVVLLPCPASSPAPALCPPLDVLSPRTDNCGCTGLAPPSDRRRLSPKLLCLNLLRELHALLRTELFCPRFLAPLTGRAECLRRFLILCSILLQSTITGHPDLLLQQPQFGLPCVGTT